MIGPLFLGALALAILWFGREKGFFHWTPKPGWNPLIRLWHVSALFLIYFVVSLLASALLPSLLSSVGPSAFAPWFVFLSSLLVASSLLGFCFYLPKRLKLLIWRAEDAKQPYMQDIKMALIAWCLAFPTVLFVSECLESLTLYLSQSTELPDQLAVHFVRSTFHEWLYFLLSALSIAVLAPLMEELLFRGFLQSFIRKHLGSKQAIFITALCFSAFHYSREQSFSNIPIIGSLFILALFLGFLYEKQRSLAACLSLHSCFNLISIFNLYFFGEIPRSPL
jgi:membrane protease YdiL (CAAX protease family)